MDVTGAFTSAAALWDSWLSTPGLALMLTVGVLSFCVGGVVKGAIGVGLPMLAVPMMSLVMPAPQAMALVAVPVMGSNLWQVWTVGQWRQNLRRFWPLSLAQLFATILTVRMTLELDVRLLNRMLAGVLVLAVVLMAFKPQFDVSPRRERWVSACVGMFSGMLGAVSSLTGPIIITYMMALRLSREQFMGGISIVYFFGSLPLYSAMFYYDRMGLGEVGFSFLALLPMALGLYLGRFLGQYISEKAFRQVLFAYLLSMAALLVWR